MATNENKTEGAFGKPPRLHRDDYRMWKKRMTSFLILHDIQLWKVIMNGPILPMVVAGESSEAAKLKEPSDYTAEDEKNMIIDEKAKAILYMALPGELLENVYHCSSAKEIWDSLADLLEGTSDVKNNMARVLVQKYECFSHENGESLTEQYERFVKLISQLKSHGKSYPTDELSVRFMRSLPSQWITYTTMIKKVNPLGTMTLAQLYGELRTHELEIEQQMRQNKGEKGSSSGVGNAALISNASSSSSKEPFVTLPVDDTSKVRVTEVFDDSPIEDIDHISAEDLEEAEILHMMAFVSMRMRKFTKKTGRTFAGKRGTTNRIIQGFDKSKLTCFNCKKPGHFASECREPKHGAVQSGGAPRFPPHQQRPAHQPPQKAFVSDEYDWSFMNDEGETFALMANDEQVKSNSPAGETIIHCSPECMRRYDELKDKFDYQIGLSRSYKEELYMYYDKVKAEKDRCSEIEKERDVFVQQASDFKAKFKFANELYIETKKKLAEEQELVQKWQESAHAFQRLVKQHEKYSFQRGDYTNTRPPTDFSIKNTSKNEEECGVNVGTVDDPVILQDVTNEVEKTNAKSVSTTVPIKPSDVRTGTHEQGSSSNVIKEMKAVQTKPKPARQPQAQRVPKVNNDSEPKYGFGYVPPKYDNPKPYPNQCTYYPQAPNHQPPFYQTGMNNGYGYYPPQMWYPPFGYMMPPFQNVKKCFICGYSNHLANACYHNPRNQGGFVPWNEPNLCYNVKKCKVGKKRYKNRNKRYAPVYKAKPKPKKVWVPKVN